MLLVFGLLACGDPASPASRDTAPPDPPAPPPNVLIVLADDVGLDVVGAYEAHPDRPQTPTIDALAAQGVRFDRAWAAVSCSPGRGLLLTGRYGRRYGLGSRIEMVAPEAQWDLPVAERTLGDLAREAGYATGYVGKWHLTSFDRGWADAPGLHGFDRWRISAGNLGDRPIDAPEEDYFRWTRSADGEVAVTEVYATTAQADDALALIDELPEPWLLVLAFNAPHAPVHVPPAGLVNTPVDAESPGELLFRAGVEALDTELGRVIGAMPPDVWARTRVVFTSDNGTPLYALLPPTPPRQGKPSLTEGGLRVPLIVAGPGVEPGVSNALVGLVDVLPTVAGWLERPAGEVDGLDLAPILEDPSIAGHPALYAERFNENDRPDDSEVVERVVRDDRWKYGIEAGGREVLYDLDASPWDTRDLVQLGEAEPAVLDAMRAHLVEIVERAPYAYDTP